MRYLSLLLLTLGLAACDAGQVEPEPTALQVRDVVFATADGTVAAYSHEDHWHGSLRTTDGASTPMTVWVVPATAPDTGHDVPPRDAWTPPSSEPGVSVRVTSDDETVAAWSGTGDALTLSSTAVGAALTTVTVLRGSTTIYLSPPAPTLSSPPTPGRPAAALAAR